MRKGKYSISTSILFSFLHSLCVVGNIDTNEQLIHARRDLALAKETYGQIKIELQQLRADGDTPDDVLKDYNVYLDRVKKMVVLYRLQVQRIEGETAEADSKEKPIRASNIKPAFKHTPPPTKSLNEEFAQSLSAFDEFVLQELEIINKKKTVLSEDEELTELAADAAEAVQRLARKGIDISTNQDPQGQQGGGPEDNHVTTILNPSDREIPGDRNILSTEDQRVPAGSEGFKADDDIVARQLREAAEKETDPELKEKLFREYHAYKRALRRDQHPANESDRDQPDEN